jgi:hypothetical protein
VERTGPVTTKAGVFSFVLIWDITKDAMGEVEMGFALDEIEADSVKRARRPKVWFGHKEGSVKDDRSGVPRVMQFRVQPPDLGGESEIEKRGQRDVGGSGWARMKAVEG